MAQKSFSEKTVDGIIRVTPGAGAKKNEGCFWKIISAAVLVLAAGASKIAGGDGPLMKVYPSILAFFGTIAVCQSLGIFFASDSKKEALPLVVATFILYSVLAGAGCFLWRISGGDPFSLNN